MSTKISLVYYTDSVLDRRIASLCLSRLRKQASDIGAELVTVGRFPAPGIMIVDRPTPEPSYYSLFHQLQAGVNACSGDWVFTVEHDCLYSYEHFRVQPKMARFMVDMSLVRLFIDHAVSFPRPVLSMYSGPRQLWLAFAQSRLKELDVNPKKRPYHFCEPGLYEGDIWKAFGYHTPGIVCVDIRHGENWTKPKSETVADSVADIPGWGSFEDVRRIVWPT